MKNFEKIQAMNQEELASFLEELNSDGTPWDDAYAEAVCPGCKQECSCECSMKACSWWLAQEAAE